MRKISCLITLLTIGIQIHFARAQKVNIGDKCPDIKLTTLINYPTKEAKLLTNFNNKPLIIDFWFTACEPCIDFIPALDSLQKAYNNQFNVLLTTFEKEEDVIKFIKKNPKLKDIHLPPILTSTSDKSALRNMFPHFSEPHEIWIDKNGVVQAITSQYEITPENIEKFLHGVALDIPEKKEAMDAKRAMGGQPLLITDEQYCSGKRKLYYSWLGAADPMVPNLTTSNFSAQKGESRLVCQNLKLHKLYQIAYGSTQSTKPLKVIAAYKDTLKFAPDLRTSKNLYCYELFLKDSSEKKARRIMQKELDDYFNLKSMLKQDSVLCYVLSKMKSGDRFRAAKTDKAYHEKNNDSVYIKNIGIDYVVNNRLYNNLQHEVVNETDYSGKVDLIIPNTTDITELKRSLNKYGLDINLEMRNEYSILLQDAP
ncbi:TlpA family protein disulfide reductase [Chitinophaga varians]|uniref:TlpA family protein disulfide reductase n=1 Tax=Chitinophaga varians TaxID=2202339 RepID=UPI00165F0296|nr:TlpA disulfide reductase family protein [Chitinophaga varians]MBC9915554.1 TlpA family protein disulfide reductase [Chitinophaga varians]